MLNLWPENKRLDYSLFRVTQPKTVAPWNTKIDLRKDNVETVTIYEDWNEIEGQIWYRWRLEGEKDWHYKLTPYKQKPVVQYKLISTEEYKLLTEGR